MVYKTALGLKGGIEYLRQVHIEYIISSESLILSMGNTSTSSVFPIALVGTTTILLVMSALACYIYRIVQLVHGRYNSSNVNSNASIRHIITSQSLYTGLHIKYLALSYFYICSGQHTKLHSVWDTVPVGLSHERRGL
jgi:hypothetical protein